jgi:hypothetical protein
MIRRRVNIEAAIGLIDTRRKLRIDWADQVLFPEETRRGSLRRSLLGSGELSPYLPYLFSGCALPEAPMEIKANHERSISGDPLGQSTALLKMAPLRPARCDWRWGLLLATLTDGVTPTKYSLRA